MKLYQKSLIILVCIAIVGVGSFMAWKKFSEEPAAEAESKEAISSTELVENTVETEVITTNLYDGGWIKAKFAIQADSPETKAALEKTMFQVESTIIKTFSQMTKEKLAGEKGLELVENLIQQKLNNMLEGEKIVKVYTTDRIIQ